MQGLVTLFLFSTWAFAPDPSSAATLEKQPKHESYMRREAVLGGHGEVLATTANHRKSMSEKHQVGVPKSVHAPDVVMAERHKRKRTHAGQKKTKKQAKPSKKTENKRNKKPTSMAQDGQAPEAPAAPAQSKPAAAEKTAAVAGADAKAATPAGPADTKRMEIAIPDVSKFGEAFTITFKVKFNGFSRNLQRLVTLDNNGLSIEALGPRSAENATRIAAWFETESGLGPHDRGVAGTDGKGALLSQKLKPDTWYVVKYQKTNTNTLGRGGTVSLTVGDSSVSSRTDDHVIFTPGAFDLKKDPPATKLLAGTRIGNDDQSLDGEIGDLTFTSP